MALRNHEHAVPSNPKNLVWAIFINSIIVIAEVSFGILAGSMALISEALHNFTDIGSMSLSWWGEQVSARPNTNQKTYGYKRVEVIIAFVNGGILLGVSGWVLAASVIRIFHPEQVAGFTMLIVAVISLLGNGLAAYILEKDAKKNLNLKSAWLHSMQDALFSLGIVIAAVIIYFTGWNRIDPVVSIAVSLFLLKEVYGIPAESLNMLLDSVPKDVNFEEVKAKLSAQAGIIEVGDLHIWQTGSESLFLSAHLKIAELDAKPRMELIANIQSLLDRQYRISHATLQMVSAHESEMLDLACRHCN
ncbi:MAG: cation diffusion facilitator family transporter [Candidatus Doudnabacteria bacterium]|nr:cation diffusion facilitator family transporter [Candidatus Doudnabacteria bacterium]